MQKILILVSLDKKSYKNTKAEAKSNFLICKIFDVLQI